MGVSGALHTGFSFFGHLNAVPAAPPCGWGDHGRRDPERQRFHVLHSILLGWTRVSTKPCVSPQVFHGSMRLTGGGRLVTTGRGVKPSRQWSNPGSLKLGDALESEDMVKLLNARKHRHQE